MRPSLDCSKLNEPRQIAGIDSNLVMAVCVFFGFAAMMFKSIGVLVFPVVILGFLRGPAKRDAALVPVYLKHRHQRERYAPTYLGVQNVHLPRPLGFNRQNMH